MSFKQKKARLLELRNKPRGFHVIYVVEKEGEETVRSSYSNKTLTKFITLRYVSSDRRGNLGHEDFHLSFEEQKKYFPALSENVIAVREKGRIVESALYNDAEFVISFSGKDTVSAISGKEIKNGATIKIEGEEYDVSIADLREKMPHLEDEYFKDKKGSTVMKQIMLSRKQEFEGIEEGEFRDSINNRPLRYAYIIRLDNRTKLRIGRQAFKKHFSGLYADFIKERVAR